MNALRSGALVAIAVACLVVFAGCGPAQLTADQWRQAGVEQVWPEPPLQPRIRYLRQLTGSDDFAAERSGTRKVFEWLAGESGDRSPLLSPYGVAADGAGRVWVTDPGLKVVHAFDLARRDVEIWQAAGDGALVAPVGIAYDPGGEGDGRIFVSDAVLGTVFILDAEGRTLGTVAPPGGFGRPAGLTLADGRLYVADPGQATVEIFAADGTHLRTLRGAGPEGAFRSPVAVTVAPDGSICILDSLRFHVEVQGPDGAFRRYIGGLGDGPGYFARPRGLAVDDGGHLYVTDAAFDNVQIFDLDGRLLLYWGQNGDGPGQFNLPAYLYIDAANRIYVADSQNHRVQIFEYLP